MSTQKKSVLGRGLSALIPKAPPKEVSYRHDEIGADTGEVGIIARVAMELIRPNPFQPRTEFDVEALAELTRSIVEKGIIQPITVRRVDGGYQLVTGERRLRAAQNAGLTEIPAYIITVESDEEMLELALIENIQRETLNPIEIAHGYKRLIDECHLTQEEVADKVGKDRTTVTNFIRLLKLPIEIQVGLRKNLITMGHARALINVPTEGMQLRLYQKIVDSGISVRKIELLAKATGKTTQGTGRKTLPTEGSASVQSVEAKLRQTLGTKVSVKERVGGKGEIVIEYYSLDDLDRLLDLFASLEKFH
ncbi:MAG: ParB/RepB/Spo0J family partition protein [Ignavibacteriales bacterium]|nr:ParB/RepB/Spo0J family partition protein [Ignavibacteriales bacterium]